MYRLDTCKCELICIKFALQAVDYIALLLVDRYFRMQLRRFTSTYSSRIFLNTSCKTNWDIHAMLDAGF